MNLLSYTKCKDVRDIIDFIDWLPAERGIPGKGCIIVSHWEVSCFKRRKTASDFQERFVVYGLQENTQAIFWAGSHSNMAALCMCDIV